MFKKKQKPHLAWEASDGSDAEGNEYVEENEQNVHFKIMKDVLAKKGTMVTEFLINQLSSKN